MYNPYHLDAARRHQQELIAEADRGRIAKAVRRARRRPPVDLAADTDGRPSPARPALPVRA